MVEVNPLTRADFGEQVMAMIERHRTHLSFGPDDQGVALVLRPSHHEGQVVATVWKRDPSDLGGWWMVTQRHLDASVPAGDSAGWDQVLQTLMNVGGSVTDAMCCPF